mmetsp:Transcript_15429/g.26057  ORF Transcript_15429/g.26057 Transcript_15429/m.26057 type:complete len:102 (-) Transcript_15429:1678-1983(-)
MSTLAVVLLSLLAATPSAAFVQPALFSSTSATVRFASKKEVTNGEVTRTKKKDTNGEVAVNGNAATNGEASKDPYSFIVPILGDLHIDPRKMEDYSIGGNM